MSFILKFFDKLAEEEDDELIEILRGAYWHILFLSMLFPRWKNLFASLVLLLFYSFILGLHEVMLIYSLYLAILERNWMQASLLIHYVILGALAAYYCFFFNGIRKFIAETHRTFAKDIGHYSSGRIYAEQPCIDIKEEVKIQGYFYMITPGVTALVGAIALAGPYLSKWYSGVEHPYSPNGLSMKLPMVLYYPFSTDRGVVHYVIVGTQIIVGGVAALLIVSSELILINICQSMKYELRVIGYSMDSLRARSMYLMDENNIPRKLRRLVTQDTDFQRIVELCIKETIAHHQTMTGILSTFNALTRFSFGLAMLSGLLTIVISLYNILLGLRRNEIGNCITFSITLSAETLAIFLNCVIGAALTKESEILRDQLYFTEWYNFDLKNRKLFLNFQTAVTQPYVIKGGGIMDLKMDTFSSIMNSAYSFFNIMQTME